MVRGGVGIQFAERLRGRWLLAALVALVAAALAAAHLLGERESALARCLEGAAGGDPDAPSADPDAGSCALSLHPESFADLATLNQGIALRASADSPRQALAAARVARASTHAKVRGTRGRWHPLGKGPLHADDPAYPYTYGDGFGLLSGRVSDYAYNPRDKRVYASVASGGVWESRDDGRTWRSIGNKLPTQTVGSVEWSPAAGGTLIAVTGDNAFGGNTYAGLGVFRSTNDGRTWRRAKGVPAGAQGFKAAVDPSNPRIIYAATGAGLFRSTDGGRTFRNVELPTSPRCQGNTFHKPGCFFANVVTDVVVRSKDKFGHSGGAVLAAVGWREGAHKDFKGRPEAPGNGLYYSATGRPGTFKRLDAPGFAPQNRIGRVELGAATGARQDHNYVYAVVQDAVLFNKGTAEGLDVPNTCDPVTGLACTTTPTYLNGIYVSSDFGKSWTLMADDNQMLLPTSGSVLAQLTPLGFGPGIQSWYDEWILPDPTRQSAGGVPTRVVFGLEELFENRLPVPQDGHSDFKAIGPYNANGGACLLVIAAPACADLQQSDPSKTTTHPDQHAGIFIPDGKGGVTLLAGNDGGNYRQHVGSGLTDDFTMQGFGLGAQVGFHTLLPYGVAGAKDGVVYAGLQDNGEIRIDPKTGKQNEVYGGDGVFTLVDPANSKIVYEEYPGGSISLSTDGGKSWSDISPFVDNASFYTPLVMDPKNPKHIVTAGREIAETTAGPATTTPGTDPSTDWKFVYDLGSTHGVQNQVSALAVRGKAVYAGYCGGCDVVRDHVKFANGLATNVGGKARPKPRTSAGWHKVPAKGLPRRFISSIAIDPHRRRTIYVTLGASDLRPYAPPHALGKDGLSTRGGHVYKSTNGGKTFRDISGNLEHVPALWCMVRRGQLLVATTVGVFASRHKSGGHYALLGRNLPRAPVFQIAKWPGHPRRILAASLGRGVYSYRFR